MTDPGADAVTTARAAIRAGDLLSAYDSINAAIADARQPRGGRPPTSLPSPHDRRMIAG
jgi:hypothetical protein